MMVGIHPPIRAALEFSGYEYEETWFVGLLQGDSLQRWGEIIANSADVLVVFLAPWEAATAQASEAFDISDVGWHETYRSEFVAPRLAELAATDMELIWIEPPPTRDPVNTRLHRELSDVWRSVINEYPAMAWVDINDLLVDELGRFNEFDTASDPAPRLFQRDGIHLCAEAGRRLAERVLGVLEQRFGLAIDPDWVGTDWEAGGWRDLARVYGFDVCGP